MTTLSDTGSLESDPRRLGSGAVVYVQDLSSRELSDESYHHLFRVRRVRDGEHVVLGDGVGGLLPVVVRRVGGSKATERFELEPLGEIFRATHPRPSVGVASFLPSNDRLSFLVQKTVECGVDELYLIGDPKGTSRSGRDRSPDGGRIDRIVREACGQAKRAFLPTVRIFSSPELFLNEMGQRVALCGSDGDPPTLDRSLWLIGPESGIVDTPLASALPRVCLSTEVLRIETASIVAGALLVALRSVLVVEKSRKSHKS